MAQHTFTVDDRDLALIHCGLRMVQSWFNYGEHSDFTHVFSAYVRSQGYRLTGQAEDISEIISRLGGEPFKDSPILARWYAKDTESKEEGIGQH